MAHRSRERASGTPSIATGVLLALAASAECVGRAVISGWSLSNVLVFGLLGLSGTLPVVLLPAVPAAALVSAVAVLSLAGFHTLTVAALGASLIAFYRLGRAGSQHWGALAVVPAAGIAFLLPALFGDPERQLQILAVLLASMGPTAAWAGSTQRAAVDAEQHGAARQAIMGRLLEHTARGERARIARELHDVVAHHISVIVVQAETARLATPGMPTAGARRLLEIGDSARSALTEMRRLLGVLREDNAADEPQDRHPQPSLRQLMELTDDARGANGGGIRLIMRGRPATLDSGVELAAFRIVQEALTNARRHAPGAAVDVELVYTQAALLLRIRDNGPGPAPDPAGLYETGHGLLGMRERAGAVGGRLTTGPAPNGGFLVEASLPAQVGQSPLSTVEPMDAVDPVETVETRSVP